MLDTGLGCLAEPLCSKKSPAPCQARGDGDLLCGGGPHHFPPASSIALSKARFEAVRFSPALRGTTGSPAAARRAASSALNAGKLIRRPVQAGSGEVFDAIIATRLFADAALKIGAIHARVKCEQQPRLIDLVGEPARTGALVY